MSVFTRLFNGTTTYEFIPKRKLWYAVSALFIALSLGGLLIRHVNAGIDFTGGDLYDFNAQGTSVARVIDVVEGAGIKNEIPRVTRLSSESGGIRYRVETTSQSTETRNKVAAAIVKELKTKEPTIKAVGPRWGKQITRKAIQSLIYFLIAVFLYIWWRFEWRMGVAALAALAHDLLITAGIYALVGFEVTPSTVIATLTILGYSLYDTVVVFDKVRENTIGLASGSRMTYGDAANLAVNQTLMRSINTSLTGLIPVGSILFVGAPLGAETLKDLGLALFIGLIASTYSSIFFATPIVVELKEREPQYKALAQRVALRKAREEGGAAPVRAGTAPARPTAKTAQADSDDDLTDEDFDEAPVVTTTATRPVRQQPPRPAKPKSKGGRPSGKKRR